MIVDGAIVPNLVVTPSKAFRKQSKLFENEVPAALRSSTYCLTFMTTHNKVYSVNLDYYFLHLNTTVFIDEL